MRLLERQLHRAAHDLHSVASPAFLARICPFEAISTIFVGYSQCSLCPPGCSGKDEVSPTRSYEYRPVFPERDIEGAGR